jgi:hypothetical protein
MNLKLGKVIQPNRKNEDLTDSLSKLLEEKDRQIKE